MLQILLILFIILLGIPLGYLLAYLTRDELVSGRKYFKLLVLISSILTIVFLFINPVVALSLIFISIVSIVSLIKSYDKKFIK
tara:strand:- start:36 stop:284 length:249 start_codon:yes stop_codon:yes gene_type:complete